jgi:hypothetical protein
MARGRRLPAIKVLPPRVGPISGEDYQKAVTALAEMIGQWWCRQHDHDRSPVPGDPDRDHYSPVGVLA